MASIREVATERLKGLVTRETLGAVGTASIRGRRSLARVVAKGGYLLASAWMGLFVGAYFVLRYGGHWAEQDSQFFVYAIVRLLNAKHLIYTEAYSHGFGYPAWGGALSLLTGVSPGQLIRVYLPPFGNMLVAVLAFAVFRRLLGSAKRGLMATGLLFLVPELVFTVSRGNHEKLMVSLLLLAVLSLVQAFRELAGPRRVGVIVPWLIVYHLVAFVLLSVNDVFGIMILGAWTLSLLVLRTLTWLLPVDRTSLRLSARYFGLLLGSSWLFAVLIVGFVYPPAQNDFSFVRHAISRLTSFLEANPLSPSPNPYGSIATSWVSLPVYRVVTAYRWVLIGASALTWLWLTGRHMVRRVPATVERVLMLSLYPSFALALAVGVGADTLGLAPGSNIQVRFYSYFALFATPLVANGIVLLVSSGRSLATRRALRTTMLVVLALFGVFSLLKATLDPLISNHWIFYSPSELAAMDTWANHVNTSAIYVGPDYRLWFAWVMVHDGGLPRQNRVDLDQINPDTADVLGSRIKTDLAKASSTPQSSILLGDRVYDNGAAQVYHRFPTTPFQH